LLNFSDTHYKIVQDIQERFEDKVLKIRQGDDLLPSVMKMVKVFVAIKGSMIVMGTYFVQTSQITEQSVLGGIVIGVLSSLVLFITSFPDHDADKAKGRKTLVISLGMQKACSILWIFPAIAYGITIIAVIFEIFL